MGGGGVDAERFWDLGLRVSGFWWVLGFVV